MHASKVAQVSLLEACYPTGHNELFGTKGIGHILCVNSNL
jgi:hypothetical protein